MLPKQVLPVYETTLPISGQKVKFHPFRVKEQKILLMALEGGDESDMEKAMTQILENCVDNKIKVHDLSLVDFQYLFLQIRGKSVGEMIDLTYKCIKVKEDETPCNSLVRMQVNINDVKVDKPDPKSHIIALTPNVGIQFNYPKYSMAGRLLKLQDQSEASVTFEVINECVNSIYDESNVYTKDQMDPEELTEFLNGLSYDQFNKILNFFNTIPTFKYDIPFECRKCGHKETIHLEGIRDFFA